MVTGWVRIQREGVDYELCSKCSRDVALAHGEMEG